MLQRSTKDYKLAQNSLEIPRYRNYSFKNDKHNPDQFQRRRQSVFVAEVKEILEINADYSNHKIQTNQSNFLPRLKAEHCTDSKQELDKILMHYKLTFELRLNPLNFVKYFTAMWEFIATFGDIFDVFSELLKNKLQLSQLLQDFQNLCIYEKVIISLGIEAYEQELFQQFFQGFFSAYQFCLQELFSKIKLSSKPNAELFNLIGLDKSLKIEQVQVLLNNSLRHLNEQFSALNLISAQTTSSVWQILKKCKLNQSYKSNLKIIRKLLALWLHETRNIDLIKNLPRFLLTAQSPFLSQIYDKPILAIDLDETLVHYDQSVNKLLIRNYALEFLTNLHKYYLIIIWTAALPRYAKWALKRIDSKIDQQVDILLTREYCIPGEKGQYTKKLALLGPDVSKIMIIENDIRNICENEMDNCVLVESFIKQSNDDQTLQSLCDRLLKAYPFYQEGYCLNRAIKMTYIK